MASIYDGVDNEDLINPDIKMNQKSTDTEEASGQEGPGLWTGSRTLNIADAKEMTLNQRRLRRCKSVSRAEEIVTEDEKQRRAQPDKP